jgi:hypothetical protein
VCCSWWLLRVCDVNITVSVVILSVVCIGCSVFFCVWSSVSVVSFVWRSHCPVRY